MSLRSMLLTAVAAAGLIVSTASAQVQVDKDLATYQPTTGLSGSIKSVGSDTLNNLMTLWSEDFKRMYPSVTIEIEGKGSATAPPALETGVAQLGPMSREMKASEVEAIKKKYGYEPTKVPVAVDSLAVFVSKDNPLEQISMDQLRQVFSVEGKDMTWGDLGVQGEYADKPISLYGRNAASGTYGYFKEHALGKKDFKATVKEQPGSSAVVQAVASDKYAMGYSGIGYKTADVKALKVSGKDGKAFEANADNSYSGEYPLSRFLYVYTVVKPGEQPAPAIAEFFKFVMSQQGQQTVVKDGYYPLVKPIADDALQSLNIKQ